MTTTREYAESATAAVCGILRISATDNAENVADVIELAVKKATLQRDAALEQRVQELQAAAQERLLRMVSASPAVIYSFEATGDFAPTFVSENIRTLFGYEPAEYLGDPAFWRDRVHADDLGRVEAEISGLFGNGVHAIEYRFRRRDGSYCWVNDEQRLIRNSAGKPLEVIGSWSDISDRKRVEVALTEGQARNAHLLNAAPAVVYSFHAGGDFAPTFVSEKFRHLFGHEPRDYLEDPDFWRSRVHPEDLSRVEAGFSQLLQDDQHVSEYRFQRKDGSYCWVSDEQHLIRDEEGEPVEVVGSWSDVTARKQAKEAAAAAWERLQSLLSASPAVVYSFHATGDFAPTFISENIRTLLGYEPEAYLDNPNFWRERVHPEDLLHVETEVARLFGNGVHALEYRFRRKDGSYLWLNDEQRLVRDDGGRALEVVGSWSDVTTRKEAEDAARDAQTRNANLLSASPAVIYSFAASGDFAPTFVSDNFRALFGYEPREYLEDPEFWKRCVHPDDLSRIEGEFGRLLEQGHLETEYRFRGRDGAWRWVRDEQRLIRDQRGAPAEVVGSWSDITTRKRAEDEIAAARERLRHLMSASPAVIYSFHATGDFAPTFVSDNIQALLGYEAEEYLEDPEFWRRSIHREDLNRVLGAIPRLFEEGHLQHDYRFRRKNGSYCWVTDELRLIRDADGQPLEVVGAWTDVTAQRRVGEALVNAQNRLNHILKSSPAVIYSFEATGDFAPLFVSENLTGVLGYQPSEYLEEPNFWRDRVHPDDIGRLDAAFPSLFEAGRLSLEYRFRRREGDYIWVSDAWHLIRDSGGEPMEVVGSWSDVTARKHAELALQHSEQRLGEAISSISEGFALFDPDDRLLISNAKYGEMLYPELDNPATGMTYEEILRRAVVNGLIEDAQGHSEVWIAERLERHRNPAGTHMQRRSSGRWIQTSERRTGDGGTVAVYSDITELKQREQELAQKSETLEQLSKQLAKYLSPQLYESIFSGRHEVKVASHRRKLTVFFSDIAGFTETADRLESEDLTQLLNHYLTEMSQIALAHGATIDKYVGDAIVIFFGDPETLGVREDARACVHMALAMRKRMSELAVLWEASGIERPLQCRMGINTGYCTVGNFGSEDRLDYTIIGGGVNLASRLETAARPGQILLSYETYALIRDEIQCEERGLIDVKGIGHPIATYEVVDSYDNLGTERRLFRESQAHFKLDIELDAMTAVERRRAVAILGRAMDRLNESVQDAEPEPRAKKSRRTTKKTPATRQRRK